MLDNPASAPWRTEFEQRGFRASAAFPIRHQDHVCAVLSVYAEQAHFFQAQEIALLEEAAMDVSFALDNFTRDEARRQAEQTLRQERDFSESVLDSLPGVLYLYDESGRFVRWNKNFEKVTGYHPEEIAKLHPLDFFAGQDKERVANRISEVFQSGSSQIEAELVVRNGEALPYVFTGVTTRIDGKACLVGVGIDVSERRRAELARLESESRYRTLFDYAPDGILIADSKSRYQDANPSICRMLGYSRDELIGMSAADIIADSHQPLIEPALDMIAKQEQVPREWHFRRKDGSQFSAEVIATLMPEGKILGMIRDITERKFVEAKLRESESHLRDAQRIARLGSWELTLSDGSLRWSDQIYVIFGLDRSQFQGSYQAFLDRVHPEDREFVEAAQKLVLSTGGRLDIEHRVVLPDGKVRHVHEMADVETDKSGQPISLAGTVLDITDRKRAEREREKRHQAEAADRIKSAFLATMSHELRTPLNSIIGFTSIILQELPGPLNAEQRKQLEMVRGSARHLLALVNDVLDISKIEAGQLEVVSRPFDVRSSIEKVVATMRPTAAQKNLELRVELAPEIGMLSNDERRLEQILLNLLSNAIKFTDKGHVALRVETAREHQFKGSITSERVVCFLVSDTGIGIEPEDLNSLFQPFRQIDTGLARVHEGTGLGLAICHRLAILMGGEVHAESTWGVGSTFCLTLPLNDGEAS
jgi:PAS domain S-box-containing protein